MTKIICCAPQIQGAVGLKEASEGVELLFLKSGFEPIMAKFDDPGRSILQSIADALGVTVEQFYGGDPALKTSMGEDDCLRLWRKIGTDDGRARALEALQAIADEEPI